MRHGIKKYTVDKVRKKTLGRTAKAPKRTGIGNYDVLFFETSVPYRRLSDNQIRCFYRLDAECVIGARGFCRSQKS